MKLAPSLVALGPPVSTPSSLALTVLSRWLITKGFDENQQLKSSDTCTQSRVTLPIIMLRPRSCSLDYMLSCVCKS